MPASKHSVFVGSYDVSSEVENLSYSNADPGGYETCSFDLKARSKYKLYLGDRIRIYYGTQLAWEGRLAEPQGQADHGLVSSQIAGEGYGAQIKDNQMSMIYVDRDLSRWTGPSIQRQLNMVSAGFAFGSFSASFDPSGKPAIVSTISNDWTTVKPTVDVWYYAGPGNVIGALWYDLTAGTNVGLNDTNWSMQPYVSSNDVAGAADTTGALRSAGSEITGYFVPADLYPYALLAQQYQAINAGQPNNDYQVFWHNPAVYGNHGLTRQGPDPGGFYPQDIASDAFTRANSKVSLKMQVGMIASQTSYICPHYVQYTPVTHETVISDMAKQLGWHYGVWGSLNSFDSSPAFYFTPPPSSPTVYCTQHDIDSSVISEHIGDIYNNANIVYTDAAGVQFLTTVAIDAPDLDQNNLVRTTTLNLGVSNAAAAAAFGAYVLTLMALQSRGAGFAILPLTVATQSGGRIAACLLRAGLDRLQITDLPMRGGVFQSPAGNTFHVSRVETSVTADGTPSTRVELDQGANLIEVLQARIDIATNLATGQ